MQALDFPRIWRLIKATINGDRVKQLRCGGFVILGLTICKIFRSLEMAVGRILL